MSEINMNNLTFIVSCANGAGSSLMMKMTLEKVLDKFGIKAKKIHHCSISEGKSSAGGYSVALCAQNFINMFDDAKAKGTIVLGVKNILSQQEIEQKLREAGIIG